MGWCCWRWWEGVYLRCFYSRVYRIFWYIGWDVNEWEFKFGGWGIGKVEILFIIMRKIVGGSVFGDYVNLYVLSMLSLKLFVRYLCGDV